MQLASLPGSRREEEAVAEKWQQATDEEMTVCFGPNASEERFKAEAPGNRVIHLATHGYYMQQGDRGREPDEPSREESDIVGENPLLQSGLFFAGARTVVSALWPVSDRVTAEIMSGLYGKRNDSLPVILRNAQLKKIRDNRANGLSDHPAVWGAFIAIGDWR